MSRRYRPSERRRRQRCRSLTYGAGVSAVFDCAGVQIGLEAGMDGLRFGRGYVVIAEWQTPVCQVFDGMILCSWWFAQFVMPLVGFMLKGITIKGCLSYTHEGFQQVVEAFEVRNISMLWYPIDY